MEGDDWEEAAAVMGPRRKRLAGVGLLLLLPAAVGLLHPQ